MSRDKRYNPPPGWPPTPQGWTPPPGWQPDPSWPPVPRGWKLWVDDRRWPARHKALTTLLGVVLIIVVAVVAANAGKKKNFTPAASIGNSATPSVSTSASAAPSPSPSATSALTIVPVGTAVVVTDALNDGSASVTVLRPTVSTAAINDFVGKPKNGYYVKFTIAVTAQGKFDANPADFYVQTSDGTHYDITAGNGLVAGGDQELALATLSAGEKDRGTLTFDVPVAHANLMYAPIDQAVGGWRF